MQLWAVNSDESVCAGDTVSFSLKITGGGKQFVLEWFDPYNQLLDDNEHYSLNVNSTVLTIHDASSPHAGTYKALVRDVTYDSYVAAENFDLTVQGICQLSFIVNDFNMAELPSSLPSSPLKLSLFCYRPHCFCFLNHVVLMLASLHLHDKAERFLSCKVTSSLATIQRPGH